MKTKSRSLSSRHDSVSTVRDTSHGLFHRAVLQFNTTTPKPSAEDKIKVTRLQVPTDLNLLDVNPRHFTSENLSEVNSGDVREETRHTWI